MENVKLISTLKNSGEILRKEHIATLENKVLNYIDDGGKVTISINNDNINLKRFYSEYEIEMNFKLNEILKGSYIIKDPVMNISLETKTNKFEISGNSIVIEYELFLEGISNGTFNFEIIYEVIE